MRRPFVRLCSATLIDAERTFVYFIFRFASVLFLHAQSNKLYTYYFFTHVMQCFQEYCSTYHALLAHLFPALRVSLFSTPSPGFKRGVTAWHFGFNATDSDSDYALPT